MHHTQFEIFFAGNRIEHVNNYKYLGVHCDKFLTFVKHAEEASQTGFRSLGALFQNPPKNS